MTSQIDKDDLKLPSAGPTATHSYQPPPEEQAINFKIHFASALRSARDLTDSKSAFSQRISPR
jgi:hypothetical protein